MTRRSASGLPSAGPLTRAVAQPTSGGSWDLALVFVAGYIATAVGRVQQLFPILLPLKPAFLTAAGALVLYVIHQVGPRRIAALRALTTTCVLLLLLWSALSVPGALNQGVAFQLVFDIFIKTVLLYLLIVGSVRSMSDVERLAFVYFAVAALYAAVVLVRFQVGGGAWRLNGLYYYDANDFATLAVTAVPLGLYFFTTGSHGMVRRVSSVVGLGALAIALVRCGSRGGFLAMIAVAGFILFRYTTIRARWRVMSTAILAALFLATATDRYWSQMSTILTLDQDYNRTSETGRWHIWSRGIGYMLQHPILGVGANNFPIAEGTISPLAALQQYNIGVRWNAAHNSFVQIGAELGVPGLILFVTAIAAAFSALGQVARLQRALPSRPRGPPQLAQALTGSLIGLAVGGFFLSLAYYEMLYAGLALAVGLRKAVLAPGQFALTGQNRFGRSSIGRHFSEGQQFGSPPNRTVQRPHGI